MNRFFTPVEFPELQKEIVKPQVIEDKFPIDITPFIVLFQKLLRTIESGESDISRALVLKGTPVQTALDCLCNTPSKGSLINFLKILEQDVNSRAKQEAIKILKNGNKKVEDYLKGLGL